LPGFVLDRPISLPRLLFGGVLLLALIRAVSAAEPLTRDRRAADFARPLRPCLSFRGYDVVDLRSAGTEQNFGSLFLVMNGVWQPAQIAGTSRRIVTLAILV
jgi:hypothetical protein